MTITNSSSIVEFDADDVVAALQDVAGDTLHLCLEYDVEEFATLYADETTESSYETEREMLDYFEEVFSYVHVDFMEKDLFEKVLRGAGSVQSFVTYMDNVVIVRVFVGQESILFTVSPGTNVTELVETVRKTVE